MADGFLGRWSRRKLTGEEGEVVPLKDATSPSRPVIAAQAGIHAPSAHALAGAPTQATIDSGLRQDDSPAADAAPQPPALTLADTRSLTPESDFKPFMARSVSPEVKNAAMKKLFADPHFNVMDRLDTYIDDYSKPDPIPPAMLRQMIGSKLLGLFDQEEKDEENRQKEAQEAAARLRDHTNTPPTASVAPSISPLDDSPAELVNSAPTSPLAAHANANAGASQDHDADTDLRLQPDHATPAKVAGGSAG
ncbi:MAG: DUF3306 domain-containing protein [Bdellovibrionales bacterium]|nr:DUF3306 domain-containing protein [Ramlibacter sp.]